MMDIKSRWDIPLLLEACFFCMGSSMMVTPLSAGFAEDLGAVAALMGLLAGTMNFVSLGCRPIVGQVADRISKYALSSLGMACIIAANIGYALHHTYGSSLQRVLSMAWALRVPLYLCRHGWPICCRKIGLVPVWAYMG